MSNLFDGQHISDVKVKGLAFILRLSCTSSVVIQNIIPDTGLTCLTCLHSVFSVLQQRSCAAIVGKVGHGVGEH